MINTALLPADKDPMGAAIADYFKIPAPPRVLFTIR